MDRELEIKRQALIDGRNALGELLDNHEWPDADRVVLRRALTILVDQRMPREPLTLAGP